MDPPDSRSSPTTDWPFEVALVPTSARSILITGGEPEHWHFAARSLHRRGTFVAIVCGGDSDDAIFERTLQRCRGGVLLLQNIDQATPTQQEHLFQFMGVCGGDKPHVRVVAGSKRPLFDLVTSSVFDEALFYRLNIWHVALNPC